MLSEPFLKNFEFNLIRFIIVRLKNYLDKKEPITTNIYYLLNVFHEERNIYNPERFLSINTSDYNEHFIPYCELQNKKITCKSTPALKPWKLSFYSRFTGLIQSLWHNLEKIEQFRNKRLITFQVLEEMAFYINSKSQDFTVIFYAVDDSSKLEYLEFLSKNNIKVLDCSYIGSGVIPGKLTLSDGHPNELANQLIADCFLKNYLKVKSKKMLSDTK